MFGSQIKQMCLLDDMLIKIYFSVFQCVILFFLYLGASGLNLLQQPSRKASAGSSVCTLLLWQLGFVKLVLLLTLLQLERCRIVVVEQNKYHILHFLFGGRICSSQGEKN